jgi:hypothetical protein
MDRRVFVCGITTVQGATLHPLRGSLKFERPSERPKSKEGGKIRLFSKFQLLMLTFRRSIPGGVYSILPRTAPLACSAI